MTEEIQTTSAEYMSKAIGYALYIPLFIGSCILSLIIFITAQPIWLNVVTPILFVVSIVGFWLSRQILWQMLFIHAIISFIGSIWCLVIPLYIIITEGFDEGIFTSLFAGVAFMVLSRNLHIAGKRRKEFLSQFETQKT